MSDSGSEKKEKRDKSKEKNRGSPLRMKVPKCMDKSDTGSLRSLDVPMGCEELTFLDLHKRRLREMEKRYEDELRKKKKEWEKEVERMKHEFLKLYPTDKSWGSEELIQDPFVIQRRGSADVLDVKKMRTIFLEYPDGGRRFKIRFDLTNYIRDSIKAEVDNDIVCVTATKKEESSTGEEVERDYLRKVELPAEVDGDKVVSSITKDGILIVEAPLPPNVLDISRFSGSPSHSTYSGFSAPSSTSVGGATNRSNSPSGGAGSPATPTPPKYGQPIFSGEDNRRQMSLIVDVGTVFKARELTVQVIKDNRIMIRGKHEERTSERFTKSKYVKEFELQEKIETYSLRGGLLEDGKLLVGALGKGHDLATKKLAGKALAEELASKSSPCNVLDLATFPPTTPNDM